MYKLIFTILLVFSMNSYAVEGGNYSDLSMFPKWAGVLKKQPLPSIPYHLVTKMDLRKINGQINRLITFKGDSENNWQTPNQTRKLRTGNCKDYAVMKYYELVAVGAHPENMLVVVGIYKPLNELHAVLQVRLEDGKIYVLDSLGNDVIEASDYYKNKFIIAYGINNIRWTRTPLEDK